MSLRGMSQDLTMCWMKSEYWVRQYLGAYSKQGIIWTNVDKDLQSHITSQGHNELKIEG